MCRGRARALSIGVNSGVGGAGVVGVQVADCVGIGQLHYIRDYFYIFFFWSHKKRKEEKEHTIFRLVLVQCKNIH